MKRPQKRHDIPTDFHAETEGEALFLEQAQAFFRDLQKVASDSPNGQVINQVESAILPTSKKLVQQAMQLTLQEQVDDLEKKRNVTLPTLPKEKTASRISTQKPHDGRRRRRSLATLRRMPPLPPAGTCRR